MSILFRVNPIVAPDAISDLREAVGWNRLEAETREALKGYWATIGGFVDEQLVAWCAILSDGVYHGVLLDVIVHPDWQKQGIGRELVAQAINALRKHGVRIIHVDFLPERARFYERCGFRSGLGAIYEI